jgi:hypothetical protein
MIQAAELWERIETKQIKRPRIELAIAHFDFMLRKQLASQNFIEAVFEQPRFCRSCARPSAGITRQSPLRLIMRRRLLVSLVAAACLATTTGLASAATITDLGALSPNAFGNWNFNVSTNGSFDQIYEFSVATPTTITISESNSGSGRVTDGFLQLFSGTPTGTLLTQSAIGPADQAAQSALIGNPNGFSLTGGNYYFEVVGSLSNLISGRIEPFSGTYSLSSDVVTGVPEPSTWALLSIGLMTVGFASYRRRRSSSPPIRFL